MNQNIVLICFSIVLASSAAMSEPKNAGPKSAVEAFYKAFNNNFAGPADYATEDWNHINPYGGRDNGRDATLKGNRTVHQGFLKGVTERVKTMDFRFASNDVAVATVVSKMSPFTSPDGVKHGLEDHIRTFVVVRRGDRWLIMQDHNTTIVPLPPR